MRLATSLVLVAALGWGAAAAVPTGNLTPLSAEAAQRRVAIGTPSNRAERREVRRLERIEQEIASPVIDLAGELEVARRAGRVVERHFRRDATLPALLAAAVDGLADAADAERDRLALWRNRLGDPGADDRLEEGLRACDRAFARAAARGRDTARARFFARGCAAIDRTRDELDLAGDPLPLPPDAMPDFAAQDVNPASPSFRADVSPRDYLGKFSAWYFGHSG